MAHRAVMEMWVTALTSGRYQQGPGALQIIGLDGARQFCCLGVLCELAIEAGVLPEARVEEDEVGDKTAYYGQTDEIRSDLTLPYSVIEWAGLTECDPNVPWGNDEDDQPVVASMSMLNDTYEQTFDQLAAVVKENFVND